MATKILSRKCSVSNGAFKRNTSKSKLLPMNCQHTNITLAPMSTLSLPKLLQEANRLLQEPLMETKTARRKLMPWLRSNGKLEHLWDSSPQATDQKVEIGHHNKKRLHQSPILTPSTSRWMRINASRNFVQINCV